MEIRSSSVIDLAEYRARRAANGPERPDRPRFLVPSPFSDRRAAHRERMLRHLIETAVRATAAAANRT
jgi:hypothetical protein